MKLKKKKKKKKKISWTKKKYRIRKLLQKIYKKR